MMMVTFEFFIEHTITFLTPLVSSLSKTSLTLHCWKAIVCESNVLQVSLLIRKILTKLSLNLFNSLEIKFSSKIL
uniref:Uncharacterized protein n=1 Tax=Megaselia scalaris TaxID=36166 RepID=T1GRV9_MEGSC